MKWFNDSIETTKLDLGDGNWVEVKNFLTAEDELYIQSAGLVALRAQADVPDSKQMDIRIDGVRQSIARMEKYIVKWNATRKGRNGMEPVAVSEKSLRALSGDAFRAIDKALDAHILKMLEGKAEGSTDGEPSSAPVDGSASDTPNT